MSIYPGTFLIAFSALTLEITLTRLLSVIALYHLAFFAVSTAMLGITAGATTVYLRPRWFPQEDLAARLARVCLAYALAVCAGLILLCMTPLELRASVMSLVAMLMATAACALPFYFSGMALTAVMTKCPLPIGRLYASDLVGASLGCLFVLAGLRVLDAPSLILLCGALGALAGYLFLRPTSARGLRSACAWACLALTLLGLANSASQYAIRPFVVKGQVEYPQRYVVEKWNSISRVVVHRSRREPPHYWGRSPVAPAFVVTQHMMNIDGTAGTAMHQFSTPADPAHLPYDVVNVAYYLRPTGGACIIGVGGGRDLQSAVLAGHRRVVGVEVNPIFIGLLQGRFRSFAGLAGRPGVELVVDEARSYLTRTAERFALIQMSLIDTWAATGAGAFSLSENVLYTLEAWQVFLSRLADDGIFTVSRWHSPDGLGETGRAVSLAMAALIQSGAADPARQLAMITTENISTLLLCKRPFSQDEIAQLRKVCADLAFRPSILPGAAVFDEALARMLSARSLDGLRQAIAREPLNYEPPTDENPYFFNMLRLPHLGYAFQRKLQLVFGNWVATLTLLGLIFSLALVTGLTVVLPLTVHGRRVRETRESSPILWPGAAYFALIGAGFMFAEMALIQRLSVFLGHPVYALGILLFTIILSAGLGSALSEHLPLVRKPWLYLFPIVTALAILIVVLVLSALIPRLIAAPLLSRALASILVVFPMGLLMGFFLPTGMRLVRSGGYAELPWYWALNGICGVLCSALAVFISIYVSISTNLYIAAACYLALPVCLHRMTRPRAEPSVAGDARGSLEQGSNAAP